MARIASLGSALQDIYLIDHDDLVPTAIGEEAIFGNITPSLRSLGCAFGL